MVRLEGPEDPPPPNMFLGVLVLIVVYSGPTAFRHSWGTESSFRASRLLFLSRIPPELQKNPLGLQISVTRGHSCPLTGRLET